MTNSKKCGKLKSKKNKNMFTTKQKSLFENKVKTSNKASSFVQAGLKKSVQTLSGNGSLKLSSTLNPFVDQFGKLGSYKAPRSFSDIERDCELLWVEDPLKASKFIGYLRTIPRKVKLMTGETTDEPQLGAELKHESIFRMIWLSQKSPDTFWANIDLFVSLGSWHDVFTMLQYDLVYNGWNNRKLNWAKFGELILQALGNSNTSELVKKYLPQIKAKSACTTVESQANCMIAKWICSLLFGSKESASSYKQYRKLKTSGTAHDWQKLISQKKFSLIDFGKIHGRALNKLVRSKFLANQGLTEKYGSWVKKATDVKYTGFVHELFNALPYNLSGIPDHQQDTINKQFDTLVQKAKNESKENQCNFIVARDISGSMKSPAVGLKMSSFDVAKSLALYFSQFLTGPFADSFITFESKATMHQWKGKTVLEKWYNEKVNNFGSTNFQSVIDLFCNLKAQGIPENEFPTGILAISDGDFNPTECGNTNVKAAKNKLVQAGFSKEFVDKFVIVLWNIPNGFYSRPYAQFEGTANETGAYYFGGFSPSIISFLMGKEIMTPEQLFDTAMNQNVLNLMEIK